MKSFLALYSDRNFSITICDSQIARHISRLIVATVKSESQPTFDFIENFYTVAHCATALEAWYSDPLSVSLYCEETPSMRWHSLP
jgi:hypothetical protein